MGTRLVKAEYGYRRYYTGTFKRYILTSNGKAIGQRLEFENVRDEHGNLITDYTWFDNIKAFSELNLKEGDRVLFRARDMLYEKEHPDFINERVPIPYNRLFYPNKAKKLINPVKIKEKEPECLIKIPTI